MRIGEIDIKHFWSAWVPIFLAVLFVIGFAVHAAKKSATDFTLPAQEQLEIERLQTKAFLAQKDFQAAQNVLQNAFTAYTTRAEELRAKHVKEDGWASTVQFDPNTATFRAVPTPNPAAAAPPATPAPPKK